MKLHTASLECTFHIWLERRLWLQTVEATAEAGQLTYKTAFLESGQLVLPIQDYVVLQRSITLVMHGEDIWQGAHVSEASGDHSLWDADMVCTHLLAPFFTISGALPFPSLSEYSWSLDKVLLVSANCSMHILCFFQQLLTCFNFGHCSTGEPHC